MTETMIWRAQRTRVYTTGRDNPWSRTGSIWREQKAYLARLGVDRQEEVEDWEVYARPRPVRSFTPSVTDAFDWFDAETFASLWSLDEDYELAALERNQRPVEIVPVPPPPVYSVLLEDNTEMLAMFEDDFIERRGACWVIRWRDRGSRHYYPPKSMPSLTLLCSDGAHRAVTGQRMAWVIEYGSISTEERLQRGCTQHKSMCVAPDHQRKTTRRKR